MSKEASKWKGLGSWLSPASRWLALPAFAIAAALAAPPPAKAAIPCTPPGLTTFNLTTDKGYISTPDGNSVYMWSYRRTTLGSNFQIPSPVLCVTQGQTVTINLTNPASTGLLSSGLPEATSLVFPGQTNVQTFGGKPGLFANEIGPGPGTVTYRFVASQPGTYLYESGTNPHKQVHMGLYGVLIVRPSAAANRAYTDPDTVFDASQEYLVLIHEIDPELHQAVEQGETYDATIMHDRYWTINGRSFPDTILPNNAITLPDQPYSALVTVDEVPCAVPGSGLGCTPATGTANRPALIRYANAGMVNHPFHPHGNHLRVIARDGRLLGGAGGTGIPAVAAMEAFTKTIGSGQTYDLLVRWVNEQEFDPTLNQVPVTIPDLQNLKFKDDVTWYSGSPYLGVQDDLPPTTTSFNECGELYYPWHSHALNEFQNFDEGFGGLATLFRVDPTGGCP